MTPNGNIKMAKVGRPPSPTYFGIGKLCFRQKARVNPWTAIVRMTDTQQMSKVFPTQEDAIKWIKSFVNENLSS